MPILLQLVYGLCGAFAVLIVGFCLRPSRTPTRETLKRWVLLPCITACLATAAVRFPESRIPVAAGAALHLAFLLIGKAIEIGLRLRKVTVKIPGFVEAELSPTDRTERRGT